MLGTLVAVVTVYTTVRLADARDRALAEAARTGRIQEFMLRLFQAGEDQAGPPDSLHIIDLVERGVHEAGALTNEPLVQAELYRTLGGSTRNWVGSIRPIRCSPFRWQGATRSGGADHPDVATGLVSLGLLRLDQARLEEAERLLIRDGLAMTRRHQPANHPDVVSGETALGRILQSARGLSGRHRSPDGGGPGRACPR